MSSKTFRSLDLYSEEDCEYGLIEKNDLERSFATESPYAIMGSGRSLVGAYFGKGVRVLQQPNEPPMIELDRQARLLRVSASATVCQVYNFLIDNHYILTGLPSYPGVTIGGCVAANVHGQNHYREGCFVENIIDLTIYHPDFGQGIISRTSDKELFDLTVGGFGLTGIIIQVTVRVVPVHTDLLNVSLRRFNSLEQGYEMLMLDKEDYDYFHGWVDLANLNPNVEKGFYLRAKFRSEPRFSGKVVRREKSKHTHLAWKLNVFGGPLLKTINKIYSSSINLRSNRQATIGDFIFPSKNKLWYFSMFGREGIIEHQVLIPHSSVRSYILQLKQVLIEKKPFMSLCHMKLFKGRKKLLNFDGDGLCLAIHFKTNQCSLGVLEKLDHINVEHDCITNIIKDSRVPPIILKAQYSQYDEFLSGIRKYDPNKTFENTISQRLFL